MAAGLSKTLMSWTAIIEMMNAEAPTLGRRGPYQKKAS